MPRPTKYNNKIPGKVMKYLEKHESLGDVIPSFAGLACYLKLNKDTLFDWAKHEDKPKFSDSLDQLRQIQERKLLNGGLGGSYNPAICRLVLNNHGYTEKQELTGAGGEPLQIVTHSVKPNAEKD